MDTATKRLGGIVFFALREQNILGLTCVALSPCTTIDLGMPMQTIFRDPGKDRQGVGVSDSLSIDFDWTFRCLSQKKIYNNNKKKIKKLDLL